MEQLEIKYENSKLVVTISVLGAFLLAITYGYLCVNAYLKESSAGFSFYIYLIICVLGLVGVVVNYLNASRILFYMDSQTIKAAEDLTGCHEIQWVNVSRVSFGPTYILFHLNGGQKQEQVSLSTLKYKDVMSVKAKVLELCDFKNIPYSND